LQRRLDLDFGFFPLLYVGTACAYLLLAVPAGLLADRFGRGKVLAGGYVLLLLTYTALLRPAGGPAEVGIYLVLFGAYYAATDGVLMALASARIPVELRASGLGLLTTVTSLARLAGSIAFGFLWTWQGDSLAIGVLFGGLLFSTLAALTLLRQDHRQGDDVAG
jgi:MFS family permease